MINEQNAPEASTTDFDFHWPEFDDEVIRARDAVQEVTVKLVSSRGVLRGLFIFLRHFFIQRSRCCNILPKNGLGL